MLNSFGMSNKELECPHGSNMHYNTGRITCTKSESFLFWVIVLFKHGFEGKFEESRNQVTKAICLNHKRRLKGSVEVTGRVFKDLHGKCENPQTANKNLHIHTRA